MSKYLQKLLQFSVFFLFISSVWAQSNSVDLVTNLVSDDKILVDEYLDGYILNSLYLQELKLKVEEAKAKLDEVMIENGLDVTTSTGTSTLKFADSDLDLKVSPSIIVSIPKSKNTVVTTTAPIFITSNSETYFSGVGLSVSRDIISSTSDEYALNIEYYERVLFEAQLAVNSKLIMLKSEFWEVLYNIYSADKTMKEDSEDLFDKQIDFDTIKAQGYSENSSTYRIAELDVKEGTFIIEKNIRKLKTLLGGFAVDCGLNPGEIKGLPNISTSYYNLKLVDIRDYKKDNYIELEDAIQNFEYKSKLRNADSDFSLSASAGYDYTGYSDSSSNNTDYNEGNKVSTELSATYGGLTSSVGISTLFEDPTDPSLTFSFSYNFGTNKKNAIYERQDDIERRIELLVIESANESLLEDGIDFSSTKATLEWTREQNAEQLNLYKEMYDDSVDWFQKNIISETDLLQAKNRYEIKRVTTILTIIDSIIYNLDTEKLFLGDK